MPRSEILFADHHRRDAARGPRRRRLPQSGARAVSTFPTARASAAMPESISASAISATSTRLMLMGALAAHRDGACARRHPAQEGRRAGGDGLPRLRPRPQRRGGGGVASNQLGAVARQSRELSRLLMRPLPACGERAALIVQQTRSGEGARPAPHPVLSAELSTMPSPRLRGEAATTSACVSDELKTKSQGASA